MNLAFQTQIVSDLHVVELCFTTSQACGALIDLHLGILLGRDVVFFKLLYFGFCSILTVDSMSYYYVPFSRYRNNRLLDETIKYCI